MRLLAATYVTMEYHKKLRLYMKRGRISQEEMGEIVGVSQNQVSRWTRGQNRPDVFQAAAMAERLRISLDHMVDVEAPPLDDEQADLAREVRKLIASHGLYHAWELLSGIAPARKEGEVLTPVTDRTGEAARNNRGVG